MIAPKKEKQAAEVDEWKELVFLYNSAMMQMNTKINILIDEFKNIHNYNPIEHIKSRIKTPTSIVNKLKKEHLEVTLDNMKKYLHDIAGVRIICSFTSDIYMVADMIRRQNDVKVITVKDYIKHPKDNGYKSYHMVVALPVYLSDGPQEVKVELQIRTIAMDFWASLEHKIYYKYEGKAPLNMKQELRECADMVNKLDEKMLLLNEQIKLAEQQTAIDDMGALMDMQLKNL